MQLRRHFARVHCRALGFALQNTAKVAHSFSPPLPKGRWLSEAKSEGYKWNENTTPNLQKTQKHYVKI